MKINFQFTFWCTVVINGGFICLALVVPTLDLTVVSVGRVAGFVNYNTEYLHTVGQSRDRTYVTSSEASNKESETILRFNLFSCKQRPTC